MLLLFLAGFPAVTACNGGGGGGATPSRDSASDRVASGLEHVVGRAISDVSCWRLAPGGYRCALAGEHGCEVVDPIVRNDQVTGIDQGALAEAAVCAAGRLTATPARVRPAEVADAFREMIEEGRWAAVFDSSMRRVSCVRELVRHATAQYRCAARAGPPGTEHVAFVQSDGDRIVAVWPIP